MNVKIVPYDQKYFSVRFLNGFDSSVLDAVRKVKGRVWYEEEKAWLIPLTGDSCEMLLSNLYNTRLFNVDECRVDLCDSERNINAEITKIKEALIVRRYSPHTVERYCFWVRDFLLKVWDILMSMVRILRIEIFILHYMKMCLLMPFTK